MMALSQPLEAGDSLSFDAFSGTTRYIFELKVVRRERIGTPLGEFDAFRIVPTVALSKRWQNKRRGCMIRRYGCRPTRAVCRCGVESAVFIGTVRIDLVKVIDPRDESRATGRAIARAIQWPLGEARPLC